MTTPPPSKKKRSPGASLRGWTFAAPPAPPPSPPRRPRPPAAPSRGSARCPARNSDFGARVGNRPKLSKDFVRGSFPRHHDVGDVDHDGRHLPQTHGKNMFFCGWRLKEPRHSSSTFVRSAFRRLAVNRVCGSVTHLAVPLHPSLALWTTSCFIVLVSPWDVSQKFCWLHVERSEYLVGILGLRACRGSQG